MGYGHTGLTFNALRQANLKRLPLFKNAQGEPAHSEPDGSDWSPSQWLQAVVGELGELANLMKKVDRGDFSEDQMEEITKEIGYEIADVQIYLDILAFRLGINLGRITEEKFNVTSKKVNVGVRLEANDWHWDKSLGEVPSHVKFRDDD